MMKKIYLLLAMGIILSLILSPGCKTGEESSGLDIRGLWNFDISCPGCYFTTIYGDLTLAGSITGGTATFVIYPGSIAEDTVTGTWTISGSSVTIQFTVSSSIWQFGGIASSASSMAGTGNVGTQSATWTATK
jgi:hypothetical protein